MKISKNKLILTIILVFTFIVFGIFMLIFFMNRPTLVLSDMVSYAPTSIEISTVEDTNNRASITDNVEIEKFLYMIKAQTWDHKSDITYNSESEANFMCVPSYYVQINKYQVELLCKDEIQGYGKIDYNGKEYLYTIPLEVYTEIETFLDSHKEVASG
ncbi:MAG: hypothetical protein NAG76_08940 [Candidatus Pristimantibacillus lignocellulolyticus]|uniref:Uncharacterized protein n=1 Tax=Candidatus Pristimantibacillus lignocellulolyticus TaxID=2994561 RepID=A0A9J6ZKG4_9BACL|nr:MAG: hypothetical protein NAG76_08940 [Candidatus Pristimantibacillus lignocellulolyticus]